MVEHQPTFKHSSQEVLELIKAEKTIDADRIVFKPYDQRSQRGVWDVRLAASPLARLRLCVSAGVPQDPKTYSAALLLDGERVRGIDYQEIAARRFYREVRPKGWHQNVVDPTRDSADTKANRHEALSQFDPTDVRDFLLKVCKLWNIRLPITEEGLL